MTRSQACGGSSRSHFRISLTAVSRYETVNIGVPVCHDPTANTSFAEPAAHSSACGGPSKRTALAHVTSTSYADASPMLVSVNMPPRSWRTPHAGRGFGSARSNSATRSSWLDSDASSASAMRRKYSVAVRAVRAESAAACADLSNVTCVRLLLHATEMVVTMLTTSAPMAAIARSRSVSNQWMKPFTTRTVAATTDSGGRP